MGEQYQFTDFFYNKHFAKFSGDSSDTISYIVFPSSVPFFDVFNILVIDFKLI